MKKVPIGLKALYIGNIESDGSMSQSLEQVTSSIEGTPVLQIADGNNTKFNIEESDYPYFEVTTPGEVTLAGSAFFKSPSELKKYFGGTVTLGATSADPDKWDSPVQILNKEVSAVAVHKQGGFVKIPRAMLSATFEWKFQKNGLPQVNFKLTVLQPETSNTPPMTFNQAEYSLPVITEQPDPATLEVDDALTLSVTATGATSYQWKKDGVNISGATSATYTKTAVLGDAGTYKVVITNSSGSVSSDEVVVAVS